MLMRLAGAALYALPIGGGFVTAVGLLALVLGGSGWAYYRVYCK